MATGTYAAFKTDTNREVSGIELDYGDFQITIARAGGANKRYAKMLEVKTRPHRRAIQTETMSTAQSEGLFREVYAEAVILGWSGVTDESGKVLTFSRANCMKLLTDLPDLFDDIKEQATKVALFRESLLEDDAKNSLPA